MEMTMNDNAPPKWRKHLVGLAVGMTTGIVGAAAGIRLIESGRLGEFGGSQVAAAAVGLVYLLTGMAVAAGLLSPKLGAQFLNVSDAEELREQRMLLGLSAFSMVLSALALFVLASAGVMQPSLALGLAIALLAPTIVLGIAQRRLMDELLRQVSSEAGSAAFYLTMVFGGGWSVLAHLGFVPAAAPLDWITMFFAVALIAAFAAAGSRGLLNPR